MPASLSLNMSIVVMIVIFFPMLSNAKPSNDKLPVIDFLAETVVFCNSRDSLASYKDMADVFDLDGLNNIVLAGECDFVPDGKYLTLHDYHCHAINSTDVIVAAVQGFKVWTFVSLVSRGYPGLPRVASSDFTMDQTIDLKLSRVNRDIVHCP